MTLIPFDDRDGQIWWDGEMVPWRDAKLHVLSHGLHYASGVFEGERAYAGNIFMLRAHTDRLIQSGRILGFEIPWTAEQIDAACQQVVAANGLVDAYVRPIAWRGSEQLSVAAQNTKVHLAIACWAWPNLFGDDRMKGVRLGIAKWKRPSPETAPTASKAAGLYMIGTLAKHQAADEGWDDALMYDWRGHVAEGTGANICFVFDGELHTPTPEGFLDSITRARGDGPCAQASDQGGGADDPAGGVIAGNRGLPGRHRCGGDPGAADRPASLHAIADHQHAAHRVREAGSDDPGRGDENRRMRAKAGGSSTSQAIRAP